MAWAAAILAASCSSSSSRSDGLPGNRSPNCSMKDSKRRVERLSRLPLLDHPVERVECLAHVVELGGVGVGERLGHLVEVGLRHLFAQPLHELLEVLARLGGHELIVLEPAHRPGQVAGQQVERHPPLGGHLGGDLLATLVPRGPGILLELFDAEALLGHHLLQLLGYLPVGAAQVTLVELVLTFEAELVEQVPQPLDLVAVRGAPPTVEHPLQRLVHVAVGQQVVGELRQDPVGVVDLSESWVPSQRR